MNSVAKNPDTGIVLASSSPRRRELLTQLGLAFRIVIPDVDESPLCGEHPRAYVERMAMAKAAAVNEPAAFVIGSDTSVIQADQILGKPSDYEEFRSTMKALSGKAHEVMTGVAVVHQGEVRSAMSVSTVWFRVLTENDIAAYWASGEPADKAGGYGIQGRGALFVRRLEGSYSAVMGLPLYETVELLAGFGVDVWRSDSAGEIA